MSFVLLRPAWLSYRNRFSPQAHAGRIFNLEIVILGISGVVMFGLYMTIRVLLARSVAVPELAEAVPAALLRLMFVFFFVLLTVSSFIGAIGTFFEAKDLPLCLTSPVGSVSFFCCRFIETLVHSSWMFILFGVPAVLAAYSVLDLHWMFLVGMVLAGIPFLAFCNALGILGAIIFMNVVPVARMSDILAVSGFSLVFVLLLIQQNNPPREQGEEGRGIRNLAVSIVELGTPAPPWLPARWPADVAEGFLRGAKPVEFLPPALLLLAAALGAVAITFLAFEKFHWRAWNLAVTVPRKMHIRPSPFLCAVGRVLFPCPQQFRALLVKEGRMFLRDTVQALQLLFILTVTCLYVYNFRALRQIAFSEQESHRWLQVFLCIVNLCFASSVVAAIGTRFVFPSLSLEGRAYVLLRAAPLSIAQYLRYKLWIWAMPMVGIGTTLALSGAMALFVQPPVLLIMVLIMVPLSISTTALGIGIGAVYVKFDWESPSQVLSSFGGLIHMLLSLGVIFLTAIPATYLFTVTTVPRFAEVIGWAEYVASVICSYVLVLAINYSATKAALKAGAQSLQALER